MNFLIITLVALASMSTFSQVNEVGTLKAYSESIKISSQDCLNVMNIKYGRMICRLSADNLENNFIAIEFKSPTRIVNIEDCRISIIRKIDHIKVSIGEFDEKITKEKTRRCLNLAVNQEQLYSKLNFIGVKK